MDKNQVDKIVNVLEAQNKNLEKTVELLRRLDENIKSLNQKTTKSGDFSSLMSAFDKASFASMVISLDKIHELLKIKLK